MSTDSQPPTAPPSPRPRQLILFPPTRPLAERFGAEFFRTVPEQPGVYLMSTARDGVLYVGKAKNLRRRLGSYRSGSGERLPRKLVRLLMRVERIDWDICADEVAALERERRLIRTLQPRFNTMGVRPPKGWFIGWQRDADVLTLALDESPVRWPNARGPFVFAQYAFGALLRSLWFELNPGTRVIDLPSRLLARPGPRRWRVPWNDAVRPWLADLEQFLAGMDSRLAAAPPADAIASGDQPGEGAPVRIGSLECGDRLPLCLHDEKLDAGEFVHDATQAEPRLRKLPHPTASSAGPIESPPECAARDSTDRAIGPEIPPPLTFDEQWRALDAECLLDFHERLARIFHAFEDRERCLHSIRRCGLGEAAPTAPKADTLFSQHSGGRILSPQRSAKQRFVQQGRGFFSPEIPLEGTGHEISGLGSV